MSMKVVIIEDEKLAAERLVFLLNQYDPNIQIVAHLYSVSESIDYLLTMPHPDVIFMDIQLSDGICFDIFQEVSYQKPIIFTTNDN
jgi:two-component system, LytTR family, response regulator LytT